MLSQDSGPASGWAHRAGHQQQAPESFLKAPGQFGAGVSPPQSPQQRDGDRRPAPPRVLSLHSVGLVPMASPFPQCPESPQLSRREEVGDKPQAAVAASSTGLSEAGHCSSPSRWPRDQLGGAGVRWSGSPWPLQGLAGHGPHWSLSATVSPEWRPGKEGCPALQETPHPAPTWMIQTQRTLRTQLLSLGGLPGAPPGPLSPLGPQPRGHTRLSAAPFPQSLCWSDSH